MMVVATAFAARLTLRKSDMPIRTATLSRQLQKNGARLHLAMVSQAHSSTGAAKPSERVQALIDERRQLKETSAARQAQAKLPKVKAERVVKELKAPKPPKAPKAAKEPKVEKAPKGAKGSRTEKKAKKDENVEAAKKADRKSASKT